MSILALLTNLPLLTSITIAWWLTFEYQDLFAEIHPGRYPNDGSIIYAMLRKLDGQTTHYLKLTGTCVAACAFALLILNIVLRSLREAGKQVAYSRELGRISVINDEPGVFERGSMKLYRDIKSGPVLEMIPKEVVYGGGEVKQVSYTFKTPESTPIKSESVLPSGYIPIPVSPGEAPRGLVMISLDGELVGMGTRIGNLLTTARHVVETPGDLRLGLPFHDAKTLPLSMHNREYHLSGDASPATVFEHTGRDLVAYSFDSSFWTKLGVSAFSPKHLSKNSTGAFRVFTYSSKGLVKSVGNLSSDARLETKRGLLSHTASTIDGYSGSPLIGKVNGVEKLLGVHVAGGNQRGKNYAVTIWSVMRLLEVAGVSTKSAFGSLASLLTSESQGAAYYDKNPQQEEFSEWDDTEEREMPKLVEHYDLPSAKAMARDHDNFLAEVDERDEPTAKQTRGEDRFNFAAPKGAAWDDMVDESTRLKDKGEKKYDEAHSLYLQFIKELARVKSESKPAVTFADPEKEPSPGMSSQKMRRPYTSCWPEGTPAELRDTANFWSTNESDLSALAPEPSARPCQEDLHDWMKSGSATSLALLSNVGIDTIREDPVLVKYWDYVACGQFIPSAPEQMETENQTKDCKSRSLAGKDGKPIATCIGRYAAKYSAPSKKLRKPSAAQAKVLESAGIKMGTLENPEFVLPPHGPADILASLDYQLKRVDRSSSWAQIKKSPETRKILANLAKEYPQTTTGLLDFPKLIDRMINHLEGDKSSGFSAMYLPGQKQAWKDNDETLKYMVTARLALRVAAGDKIHHYTPEEMVSLGLKDPEVLQIKEEPHKKKKISKKRWRLIWLSSVVDVVTQMVTHFSQNKADIASYQDGILKSQTMGMGHSDEGIACMGNVIEHMTQNGKLRLKFEDVSGWDIGVLRDMWYFDAEARCICLKEGEHRPLEETLLWAEAAISSTHVVVIGKYVWTIHDFGIMGSGVYSTSATNCRGRTAELQACGAMKSCALGDDALYTGTVDKEMFSSLGHIVDSEEAGEADPEGPVSYTSHSYVKKPSGWTAQFEQIDKMLVKLVLTAGPTGPKPDQVSGCKFAIRHTPSAQEKFNKLVEEQGWKELVSAIPAEIQ